MAVHGVWGLALVLAIVTCSSNASTPFDGFELISVTPQTKSHVSFLHQLEMEYEELDFWQPPVTNRSCKVLVPKNLLAEFKDMMHEQNIPWRVANSNIMSLIEASYGGAVSAQALRADADDIFHTSYHDYEEIKIYLKSLADLYPDNVQLSSLAYLTHQGRSVILVKLHGLNAAPDKPSIIVEAGIHAREWVSPAATLFAIDKILQGYQTGSPKARQMLDTYDWYFVPVTNPDGYVYTHTSSSNRLWRKNMRAIASRCAGVDLNRNFDIYHGTTGVSFNCRSQIYPGFQAFSEPESANIRELFYSLKDSVVGYLSVHSYSQFLLVPWGYSESLERPNNAVELEDMAMRMSDAMYLVHRKVYEVGTAWQLLEYAASGSSKDWALAVKPGIYALAYELRPDYFSDNGFLLSPREIIPTGEEFLVSLEVLAANMKL